MRKSIIEMKEEIESDYATSPLYDEGITGKLKILEREVDVCELVSASREDRLLEIFCGASFSNI
jgi:hypothetical protein